MKICLFILLSFISLNSRAQFLQDANNRPVKEKSYIDITGSPYFSDQFYKGVVLLSDNKKYDNLFVNLDQVKDALLFKNQLSAPSALEFTTPVVEFTMEVNGVKHQFINISNSDSKTNGFYEVLLDGQTSLLKRTKKNIIQNATYGTANVEKTIASSISYALLTKDKKIIGFKSDKKSFLKILTEKTKEVDSYITVQNIDFKNDSDLVKLVSYYNSL